MSELNCYYTVSRRAAAQDGPAPQLPHSSWTLAWKAADDDVGLNVLGCGADILGKIKPIYRDLSLSLWKKRTNPATRPLLPPPALPRVLARRPTSPSFLILPPSSRIPLPHIASGQYVHAFLQMRFPTENHLT